jgi:hypothetical protein
MLFQSLRAFCKAPGGAGSISRYLEALVRETRVSERFAYGFQTEIHVADESLTKFKRPAAFQDKMVERNIHRPARGAKELPYLHQHRRHLRPERHVRHQVTLWDTNVMK